MVFLPVFLALVGAIIWGVANGAELPWKIFLYYSGLLFSLSWCFLGIGMLISTLARSADVAQGAAFIVWLALILFLDLILLGTMIRESISPDAVVAIALANPLQVFRTAAMLLFDAQLVLLGPSAYLILDHFGETGYLIWSLLYPVGIGSLSGWIGYRLFLRSDLP